MIMTVGTMIGIAGSIGNIGSMIGIMIEKSIGETVTTEIGIAETTTAEIKKESIRPNSIT
jgi:hypothetical protein